MSKVIDERVVEMRFDNKDFEKNAHKSMETTEKLKKNLNFEGTSKGLNSLTNAISTVSRRFSVMDVVGVTALANITNSAVNTGKRMLSALTIDPVKTGLSEYETKINSIQTIMSNTASKGTTMEDVTRVINELNTYADKTIYNFAEMTRNIGTFTAAGVGLEESAKAIQGIANLAAASGSSSQQASTAMYQLSQALSTGTVRLMDWNSVVNAGMGGELFQNAIKDTAREMGVAVDDIIKKNGSFRESLSDNWLSAEILNTTLRKFTKEGAKEYADSMVKSGKYTQEQADALLASAQSMEDAATKVKTFTQLWDTLKESAQSGWSQTWEIIIGDFEEAKEVLSDLSDLIGGYIGRKADSRNKMLSDALSSKWPEFTAEINKAGVATKDFETRLKEVAKKHGISIDEMIKDQGSLAKVLSSGKLSTNIIVETLKSFVGETDKAGKSTEDLSGKLEYFQKVVNEVWRGDYGNGKKRMEALSKAGYDYATVQSLVNKTVDGHKLTLDDLSDVQLKSIGYTDDQIKSIRELAEEAEKSGTPINELIEAIQRPSGRELFFDSLRNTLKGLFTVLESVGKAWGGIFPKEEQSNALYRAAVAINEFSKKLVVSDETAGKLVRTFKGLFAIIDIILTVAGGAFKAVLRVLNAVLGAFDMDILDLTARIGDAIVAFRDWIEEHNIITKAIDNLVPHIKNAVNGIKDWIKVLKNSDNIPRDIILGLVKGFTSGIKTIVTYAKELAMTIIDTVKDVLGIHSPSTEFFEIAKNCIQGFVNGISSGANTAFAYVKNTFSKILDWLSNIDWSTIFVGGLTAGTVLSVYKIANVLETLASPFEGLGDILENTADVVKYFKKTMKSFNKLIGAMAAEHRTKALLNFALAIGILVAAIVALTLVDQSKLLAAVGVVLGLVVAMGALLGLLTMLTKSIGTAKDTGAAAAYIMAIGVTVMLIAGSIIALGMMSTSKLLKGIAAITVIMIGIAALMIASNYMNVSSVVAINYGEIGKGFKRMAKAMIIIAAAIYLLGSMSTRKLIKGGTVAAAIVASYIAIMAAVGYMSFYVKEGETAANDMGQAAKMIAKIGWSILLITLSMKMISGMSWDEIIRAGAVMGVIAVAMAGIMLATNMMTFTVDKDKKAVNTIKDVGKMFAMIGLSVLTIALSIILLGNTPKNKLIKGGIAAGLILGACVGIMAATKLLGKQANAMKNLKGLGVMFMSLGVSLLAMSFAIIALGNLPKEKLIRGSSAAVLILGSCIGIMAATKLLTNDKNSVKAISTLGKMMILFSASVLIIAGAMYALSLVDPDRFKASLGAVMLILAGFAGIMASMKFLKGAKTSIVTLSIVVGAIIVLMGMLIGLTHINPEKLKSAALSMAAVLAALALIIASTKFLKTTNSKSIVKALLPIMAVIGALVVVIGGLFLLATYCDPERLKAAGLAVAAATLGIAAMMLAVSTVSKIKVSLKDIAKLVITVAALGALIIGISKVLAIMDDKIGSSDSVIKNTVAVSIAILALAGVAAIVSKIGKTGKNLWSGVGSLYALVGVMAAIGLVLAMMSVFNPQNVMPNAVALTLILYALVGVAKLMGTVGANYKNILMGSLGLAALVGVMALIGLVLAMMGALNPQNTLANAVSLTLILYALTGVAAITGAIGKMAPKVLLGSLGLAALVGVMALIGLVLAMMSAMKVENAKENALILAQVLAVLVPIAALTGAIGLMAPSVLFGALGLAALVGVMALIGLVLAMMSAMKVENAKANALILAKILYVLVDVATALGVIGILSVFIIAGAVSLAALVGVMALIALVIGMVNDIDTAKARPNAMLIVEILQKLTEILVPLTLVGVFGPAALVGIGMLIALIAAIGVLTAGVGKLMSEFPELENFIDIGIPILNKLCSALGEFIGNFISSFLVEITEDLPTIGEDLSLFMGQLTPFIEGAKTIDESTTNGVKNLFEALDILSDLDVDDIEYDENFGTTINNLATALVDFNTKLGKDFDASTAEKAATALSTITDVIDKLPTDGGIFDSISEFFGGSQDTEGFGTMIATLGNNLKDFANAVSGGGFGDDTVTKAVDKAISTVGKISELAEALPNSGGLAGAVVGNNDLSTFASGIKSLATSLSEVSTLLSDEETALNSDVIDKFVSFTDQFIDLANSLSNTGGLITIIDGDNSFAKFGEDIKSYVTRISEIYATVSTISTTMGDSEDSPFRKLISITDELVTLSSRLENTGGLTAVFDGDNSLEAFGDSLLSFVTDLNTFAARIANVDPTMIPNLSTLVTDLNDILTRMGAIDTESARAFGDNLSAIALDGINKLKATLEDSKETLRTSGRELALAISGGFAEKGDLFTNCGSDAVWRINRELEDGRTDMYNSGNYLVEGLASGINENGYKAIDAAEAMVNSINAVVRTMLKINSPSKVFRDIGMSIPEGFAQGISRLDGNVTDSARDMASNAINSLRTSISRISEAIDSGMDVNPTITPVIDLTNVRTGVDAIGNLLEFDSQVGVMANVRAANAEMSHRRQNGINEDVVAELTKLRKDLGKTGNTTYNVNGITYDDGSNIAEAVGALIRTARIERRI